MRDERKETCPRYTPWGGAQSTRQLFPGCWTVETSSHGGFYVAPAVLATMPESLSRDTFAGAGWFEEDCDWALVVCAFPQHFSEYERFCAVRSVIEWNKEKWAEFGQTDAGRQLLAEVTKFEQANGDRFRMGSMSTRGGLPGWGVSAGSIDGRTQIVFACEDPWKLKAPYTLADVEAVAFPGTLKVEPATTKAPETFAELVPAV